MDLARFDLNLLRVFEALHVHRNTSLDARRSARGVRALRRRRSSTPPPPAGASRY